MSSPLIDTHIHIYSRAEIGRFLKDEYEILDYGEASVPVHFSAYDGDATSAIAALERAEIDYALALNIFALYIVRKYREQYE